MSIERLNVVVLSCGDLGIEVASRLRESDAVRSVALVTAPWARKRRTLWGKIRSVYRRQGAMGLAGAMARRLVRPPRARSAAEPSTLAPADPAIRHFHFPDFHHPDCVATLRELAPDLGLVAGTYILREEVFAIPRLGSVNLHSGKVPEYRGSAPAFWELYNGEREVGITIHRVTEALDAGDVLLQETFPIDPAPDGDPLRYIEAYRERVLRPNGVRLLVEAVEAIAADRARPRPQAHGTARTYPLPDHRAVRELRRRVNRRRREGRGG